MALVETLPINRTTAQWPIWSTTARLVVTDPDQLAAARRIVLEQLARVELACSRFRWDSELRRIPADGSTVEVSPLFADLLASALRAAQETDGDVDPTVGCALAELGYDRDLKDLPTNGPPVRFVMRAAPGWQRIDLRGRLLAVPPGIALDLGATAKAYAADLCADHVARELGVGVLLALGGDIATAGAGGDERWTVLVQDRPGDPAAIVGLQSGSALATSSTSSREWRRGAWVLHHIIDPRTCSPVPRVWRTVSVASHSCLKANTLTTAALVRGHAAVPWLREARVPARLVGSGGGVVTIGGWPKEATP